MVAGMLMAIGFLSLASVIEAGLHPGRPDENGEGIAQNAFPSGALSHGRRRSDQPDPPARDVYGAGKPELGN